MQRGDDARDDLRVPLPAHLPKGTGGSAVLRAWGGEAAVSDGALGALGAFSAATLLTLDGSRLNLMLGQRALLPVLTGVIDRLACPGLPPVRWQAGATTDAAPEVTVPLYRPNPVWRRPPGSGADGDRPRPADLCHASRALGRRGSQPAWPP